MLFPNGKRPDSAAIRALAKGSALFDLSLDPFLEGGEAEGWVELLFNGLTFDLLDLAPGAGSELGPIVHSFDLPQGFVSQDYEAVTLRPGPHIAGGGMMFPVVRCMAQLSAELTRLPDAAAVIWHPARASSGAEYFRRGVLRWLEGRVFPGLGLTALAACDDGTWKSEGLSLFTGQEVFLEAGVAPDSASAAKTALRLINWLVEHGGISVPVTFTSPEGQTFHLAPDEAGSVVRVSRDAR